MKRAFILSLFLLVLTAASAQTQQGVVKTKGRMVNGQLQPGTKLAGAVIAVRGRSAVLSQNNGQFSFPVSGQTFMLDSVRKKGYQLVDAEAAPKSYAVTKNPLYVLMETPEQQMQDKLNAERKIRRTLQQQLQKREDEIEALKESNRITEQEYRQQLQQLYQSQESNEKLIADMAKRYAEMDFDQLDSLNRRISDAILNGRLTEADSLLRSKGDISDRIAEVKREQQAEAQEEEELARRQSNLEASKTGTRKKLEDIAEDCLNKHELCKMRLLYDSAAYYIVQRAELDTMNVKWQFEAAYYCQKQNLFRQAIEYYERSLAILRHLVKDNSIVYESDLAATLNNLANLYSDIQRLTDAEEMYKQALEIRQRLAKDNPKAHEPDVAGTLNNLANLYYKAQRFKDAEDMYKQSLEIRQRLVKEDPNAYEHDLAQTLNNLANLYYNTQKFSEAEEMYKQALEIRQRLAKENPKAYEHDVARTLNNLAYLYNNTQRLTEAEEMYKQALEILQRMASENPKVYEPNVAVTLNNLAFLYKDTKRFREAENMCKHALDLYRRLAKDNPKVYEPNVAGTLNNLAILYKEALRFNEAEAMYKEALSIRRQLAQSSPVEHETYVAEAQYNLGLLYIQSEQIVEATEAFKEALYIYRRLERDDHAQRQWYYLSLNILGQLYSVLCHYQDAYHINQEWLPILRKLFDTNPKEQQNDYAKALGNQSFNAIFMKKYSEAEQLAREGLAVDSTQHWITSNLAAALLLQGRYSEAEPIYRQYKDELKDSFLDDFEKFKAAGVIPKECEAEVERIKKILNE